MPVFKSFPDRELPLSIVSDYSISTKTRAIYIGVIFFAILFLTSLALLYTSLKEKTNGDSRKGPETYVLTDPLTGTLLKTFKKEEQSLKDDHFFLTETN